MEINLLIFFCKICSFTLPAARLQNGYISDKLISSFSYTTSLFWPAPSAPPETSRKHHFSWQHEWRRQPCIPVIR